MSSTPPPRLPDGKYSELQRTLKWLRIAAYLILLIYVAGAAIFSVEGLLSGTRAGRTAGIASLVGLGAGGVLIYLWSMAAIGAIAVLIDIERNTRGQ